MDVSDLEPSRLHKLDNAVAGHDGVLTDDSGELVIKPCTPAEINFYEETIAHHPDFALLIPTFMGTLQLGHSSQLASTLGHTTAPDASIVLPTSTDGAASSTNLHGTALATSTAIVLQNVAAGFVRPNVLDVKLGAQLWDSSAPPSKRQRLDAVSASTTSGSLGFRVAGMRLWSEQTGTGPDSAQGREGGYRVFDKTYGRGLKHDDVGQAFEEFFDLAGDKASFDAVIAGAVQAVEEIETTIAAQESRMVSSSLLFVYEGDSRARREAVKVLQQVQGVPSEEKATLEGQAGAGAVEDADSLPPGDEVDTTEDDEDDEDSEPKLFDVRVIDFAHARWAPGEGPDDNMLQGIRSVLDILRRIKS